MSSILYRFAHNFAASLGERNSSASYEPESVLKICHKCRQPGDLGAQICVWKRERGGEGVEQRMRVLGRQQTKKKLHVLQKLVGTRLLLRCNACADAFAALSNNAHTHTHLKSCTYISPAPAARECGQSKLIQLPTAHIKGHEMSLKMEKCG